MTPPSPSRCRAQSRQRQQRRVHLELEALESRIVPYAVSANAWPHPELISISFVPDGTIVGTNSTGYITSNLFAKMNARFGTPAVWETEILRAAQSWAAQTNINFTVVPDNGTPIGQGLYQQGDPGMGDIRIGGYNFGSSTLATAFSPPPANNYSIAGDLQFNTQTTWNINRTYDLYTVAAHEMGHALGINHSAVNTAVMYSSYTGVKSSLTADDAAAVRTIYSGGNPRTPDTQNNESVATATDLTPNLGLTFSEVVTNQNLTTTSDVDYYSVTAPAGGSSTFTVTVQSTGLSLLTPAATLYAADGVTVLASASGAGQLNGSNLVLTVSGVTEGQVFYIKVGGADSSVFSTGNYAMTLNFGILPTPIVPLPQTMTLDGLIMHAGGGQPEISDGFGVGTDWGFLRVKFYSTSPTRLL